LTWFRQCRARQSPPGRCRRCLIHIGARRHGYRWLGLKWVWRTYCRWNRANVHSTQSE